LFFFREGAIKPELLDEHELKVLLVSTLPGVFSIG